MPGRERKGEEKEGKNIYTWYTTIKLRKKCKEIPYRHWTTWSTEQ